MIITYPEVPLLNEGLIGNTHNYYPNRSPGFVIGKRTNVNNTSVDVWEGPTATYVYPPAGGIQMQVVSSSASDAAAGTGVQQVYIHALDSNYNEVNIILTLNGTTAVTTTQTNILRINGFHAYVVGTGGVSAGNISLQNVGGTVTYGYIMAGFNTARQAIFTVPAGKTGYMTHWQGSSGTTSGQHFTQISVKATQHNGVLVPGVFLTVDETGTLNNGNAINMTVPIKFPATCDIKVSTISDSASAGATVLAALMGWYE